MWKTPHPEPNHVGVAHEELEIHGQKNVDQRDFFTPHGVKDRSAPPHVHAAHPAFHIENGHTLEEKGAQDFLVHCA